MAFSPYFSTITSESAFNARFKAEDRDIFRAVNSVAASHWGRPHLFACRVVRRNQQRNILPILSDYTTSADIQFASDEIQAFLKGPEVSWMAQSEHFLVRGSNCGISLAQVWAAMAMFKGSQHRRIQDVPGPQDQNKDKQDDDPETRDPKRVRRYTIEPGFVESSKIQAGSSSPQREGSYDSHQGSSLGYVDSDTTFLAVTPEDDTLRLASCVIRHILYFAAPQSSAWYPKVVDFRDAKTRLATTTPTVQREIVAIDDGGLCLRQQDPQKGFILMNNHVAVLEAKTQFQCLENGRPIISNECFAQMICEALVTKLSNSDDPNSVIVIHATQHYMCFLQIDLSPDYMRDFESATPEQFLYVSATPWFDLSQQGGRQNVLANMCGIIRRALSD